MSQMFGFRITNVRFKGVKIRAFNRIKFHFPVSECYNRVDNRIGNIAKIIG